MNDRYEIRRKIAEGGAGVVYEGWDTQLERTVAIKMLHKAETGQHDTTGTQNTPDSLLQEARSMSALQHPNIVSVYDVGGASIGEPFVVMEYLTGETLASTIERAPLLIEDFKRIANQCLQGLVAAHRKGFIHRDLKPSNIMLVWHSDDYQVKLLDFGLAKFNRNPAPQTIDQKGAVMGSIHFMAPEQFEQVLLDERTDLYQLGCVFYFTLTGVYPFEGDTAPQVMVSHLQHHVTPLRERRPDLPEWVCNWVHDLMKRDRDERITSAQLALALLEKEVAASDVPNPVPERAAPTAQRRVPTHAATARVPKPASHMPAAAGVPSATFQAPIAVPVAPSGSSGLWMGLAVGLAVALVVGGVLLSTRNNESPPTHATNPIPPEMAGYDSGRSVELPGSYSDSISATPSTQHPAPQVVASPGSDAHASDHREDIGQSHLRDHSHPQPHTKPDAGTSDTARESVMNPGDLDGISAQVGRFVTVEGSVIRVGESRSGKTRYVNFSHVRGETVAVAIAVDEMGDNFPMSRLESFTGRTVRVRGRVRDVYGETLVYPASPSDFQVLP